MTKRSNDPAGARPTGPTPKTHAPADLVAMRAKLELLREMRVASYRHSPDGEETFNFWPDAPPPVDEAEREAQREDNEARNKAAGNALWGRASGGMRPDAAPSGRVPMSPELRRRLPDR